jgi:hypothetical protein
VWTTNDEYNGSRANPIPGIDNSSFRVLVQKNFGVDKLSVYNYGSNCIPQGSTIPSKTVTEKAR